MIQLLGFCLVATMLEMGAAGADVSAAEGLWQAAERNRLSDAEAQQAAELLDHRHPFVRGSSTNARGTAAHRAATFLPTTCRRGR